MADRTPIETRESRHLRQRLAAVEQVARSLGGCHLLRQICLPRHDAAGRPPPRRRDRCPLARRRHLFHERTWDAQVPQSGRESGLHDFRQSGDHRNRPRRRGGQANRWADPGTGGCALPGGRLAGAGRGQRLHGPVQHPERRSAAVAPLPLHFPHRHRECHGRAARRDLLAIRALRGYQKVG